MNSLPPSQQILIHALASVFKNTTNSYKLYWFYALLDFVKHEDRAIISFDEMTAKMITLSWHTVNYYKVSLGVQDQMKSKIEAIITQTALGENEKLDAIYQGVFSDKESKRIRKSLEKYVPHLFLAPFFPSLKTGVTEGEKKKQIIEKAEQSFLGKSSPFLYKIVDNKRLEIHPLWFEYLRKNMAIMEAFCFWNLSNYIQNRNPNVPNIGIKLFQKDEKRDLKDAKKFWGIVNQKQPVACLYSQEKLTGNFPIDHFIPWSFVAHDMMWNLIPADQSANSSKGNKLPNLKQYLPAFASVQWSAFQIVYDHKKPKLLEDYSILFKENIDQIARFDEIRFQELLQQNIQPIHQIATNCGFTPNWTYEGGYYQQGTNFSVID